MSESRYGMNPRLPFSVAFTSGLAVFRLHIGHIFTVSSNVEMAWIHAAWIIAFVKDVSTIRNVPAMNFKADFMSADSPSATSANLHFSVSVSVQ